MNYRGETYASFKALWHSVSSISHVNEITAAGRLHRRLQEETVTEEILSECLLLDAHEYRKRYGVRKTYVNTTRGLRDVRELYDSQRAPIDYPVFRQRLKSLEKRSMRIEATEIREAATLGSSDWMSRHGGGRRKAFRYDGDEFPDAVGTYPSFTTFLKEIGRYEDRHTLNNRRKARWDIDDLLREPIGQDSGPGYIYLIKNLDTGTGYVGLSVNSPSNRFNQHVATAKNGLGSLLHSAIRARGPERFDIIVLEEVDGGEAALADREVYWIAKIGTLNPEGYNVLPGGQLGRYRGTPVTFDGRQFPSIAAMCRTISKETGLPPYVVLRYWRDDRPLPEKARKHSKHPEAGSELFRQWLGMWKRAEMNGSAVVEAWEDYDSWKADTTSLGGDGRLTRRDETLPWGPENMTLMPHSEIVRRTHGRKIRAFGRVWEVKKDALDEFGIPRNTFDHRINAGWSVDDALATPLGPTSKKTFSFEGENFPSRNNAGIVLSKRYGMTKDQVVDYLKRNKSSSEWPKHGKHVRSGMGIPKCCTVDGVTYESFADACRAYGISKGTVEKRMRGRMSLEEALKEPIRSTVISIFGYDWESVKKACKAFALPHSTFRARTEAQGMTPEQAIQRPTGRGYTGYSIDDALRICQSHAIGVSGEAES
ncbi:GIY-YIG nuclease family protein [Ruegeria atlantica]|uniref:GIY-YIG nuclease family protein n=1 Tax=Ruegeria atlantica TaxID=81569 RepID=UPI002494C683|nr:GIY-YIG nuclease family protein [Ruegeria atlantica]